MAINQISSLRMNSKFKKTPIGEIPVEWEVSTIGQCAGVNLFTIPDNTPENKKIRYIDISSIEKTGSISGIRDLFYKDAPSRARRKIEAGDILVSTVRPYLRAFAMVRDNGGDLIASTGFAVLSSTGVNGEFLYQFVLSEPFAQFLTERMTGSNYPAVNSSDVALCPIPLPPTQEQKKIAEILFSMDDAIEKADAVIAKTRDLKKALMQRLLTRGIGHTKFKKTPIGEIPVDWKVIKLGNSAHYRNGHGFKPSQWTTPGIPIIRIQNLNGAEEFNYFDGKPEEDWLVNSGDLLFSWSGSRGTSFGPFMWRGGKGVLNQHIFNVFPVKGIDKGFLFYYLRQITGEIEHRAHGSAGLVHITKQELSAFDFPVPSLAEQIKIAGVLSSVDDSIEKSETERDRLEQTKKSLMADLLTGRVRTK